MSISNTAHDIPDIENNNIKNPSLVDGIELQQQLQQQQQCPTSVVTTSIDNKGILGTSDDATAATTATTNDDEGNKTNRSMQFSTTILPIFLTAGRRGSRAQPARTKNRKILVVCGATILTLFVIGACIMMANTVVFAIGGTRVPDNGVKMKCQNGKSLQRN